MAELGLAAAPVPSITVTFRSTVDSARAGHLPATSAAMAAPNFTTRISKLPESTALAKFFTAQAMEKKQQKRFAAVRHEQEMRQQQRRRPSSRKSGVRCGLIPPYPVPIAHKQSARALRSC